MNMTTINGRTPEEIKRGLECYIAQNTGGCEGIRCRDCSHYAPNSAYTITACKDALAYIQQLERERDAAVEAQPKWISVKERLPTRELRVLTINGHGLIRIFGFFKRTEKAWTWIDDSGHFNHCNDITHWMPLPEPPKEET